MNHKNVLESNEGKKCIVYYSPCGRKFKESDLHTLSEELWVLRSILKASNFSFEQTINIDPKENKLNVVETRAFSRANE